MVIPRFDFPYDNPTEYTDAGGVFGVTAAEYTQMVYGVRKWYVDDFTITREIANPEDPFSTVTQTGTVAGFAVVPLKSEFDDNTGDAVEIPQGEEWRLFDAGPDYLYPLDGVNDYQFQWLAPNHPWAFVRRTSVSPVDYLDDETAWDVEIVIFPMWKAIFGLGATEVILNEGELDETTEWVAYGPWWRRLLAGYNGTGDSGDEFPYFVDTVRCYPDGVDTFAVPFNLSINRIAYGEGGAAYPLFSYGWFKNDANPSFSPPVSGGVGEVVVGTSTFETIFSSAFATIEDFTMTATEWWSYGGKIDTGTGEVL